MRKTMLKRVEFGMQKNIVPNFADSFCASCTNLVVKMPKNAHIHIVLTIWQYDNPKGICTKKIFYKGEYL